ncbi:MAG: FGGY family carbohydrate kinase, partial [Anaerolineaceae bacterium]
MAQKYLMAVDVGTQSTRVALLDFEGHIVSSSSTLQDMQTPRPGWAEQDPQVWWDNTVINTKKVLAQSGIPPQSIMGIGVSGQMHGAVPLDSKGDLLSHGVQLWCDKRSADLVEQLKTQPGFDNAFRIAANPPVANWVG